MKTLKHIAALVAVAALAVPAGVAAQGPSGNHGKSGDQHGQNNKNHVNSRCKHQPQVGFTLGGTLDPSSTADNIVVVVTHANKFAKPSVGADGKYTVPAGSNVTFEGSNPFTTPGADLTKYTVQVIGKVTKYKGKCTATNSPAPTIRKVVVSAPDAQQAPEQPAQS